MIYLIFAGLAGFLFMKKDDIVSAVEVHLPAWNRFDEKFKIAAQRYSVNWTWLKAISLNESNLGQIGSVALGLENPNDVEGSKSSDGLSWGLMQVTVKTGQSMDPTCSPIKLNDPDYSIDLSARYISTLMNMFSPTDDRYIEWVIKSYNQGPGNTRKEISGASDGFAQAYWDRFQRNLTRVEDNP